MIFSSYAFLLGFLPVTLAGYYLLQRFCPPKVPRLWLVAASLVFYGMGDLQYVSILMFTALFSFLIAEGLHRSREHRVVAALLLVIAFIMRMTASQQKAAQATSWIVRIIICYILVNCIGLFFKVIDSTTSSYRFST